MPVRYLLCTTALTLALASSAHAARSLEPRVQSRMTSLV